MAASAIRGSFKIMNKRYLGIAVQPIRESDEMSAPSSLASPDPSVSEAETGHPRREDHESSEQSDAQDEQHRDHLEEINHDDI
jgi:hypothetical protein